MVEQFNPTWVLQMADILVYEVLDQMAGIRIVNSSEQTVAETDMSTVYGFVDGEYRMQLQFRADPKMFGRFAENMMGRSPEEEDIRDYAEEFFNVLCGRFVSEIYRTTQLKAQFLPTKYGKPYKELKEEEKEISCTRYFVSEDRERAEFSWSVALSENDIEVQNNET